MWVIEGHALRVKRLHPQFQRCTTAARTLLRHSLATSGAIPSSTVSPSATVIPRKPIPGGINVLEQPAATAAAVGPAT